MRRNPIRHLRTLSIWGPPLRGLRASMRAHAEVASRISLAIFFAETDGNQNIGNARSNSYKGSFQTGVSEDKNGQKKWAAIKKSVAALDPALNARDDKEEARVGNSDQRYNHWTAVRNGLMNAHADLFPKIPAIMKALPNPIDQMRFFELIQIIPSPTKSALNSGNLLNYRISEPRIMGYLRNNSMFAFGKADRAKTSATMREILDSMWLFNDIFDRSAGQIWRDQSAAKRVSIRQQLFGGPMSIVSRRTFTKGLLASALVPGNSAFGQPNDPAGIAIIDTPNNAAKVAAKLSAQNVKAVVRFFARKPQPGLREKIMASDGNMIDGVREPAILIRNGLSIVSLYQYRNNLPEKFLKGLEDTASAKAEVAADAKAALDQAKLVGQPEGSAIYFGVDFNVNRAAVDPVLEYFRVIGQTVGGHYAIGVYGNGFVNRILRRKNSCRTIG